MNLFFDIPVTLIRVSILINRIAKYSPVKINFNDGTGNFIRQHETVAMANP